MITIYTLTDPQTQQLRYVGKTKHSIQHRLSIHLSEKENKAEAKFKEYVEKEAFPHEMVQLWSRLKSDDDIELVKEVAGTLILEEETI